MVLLNGNIKKLFFKYFYAIAGSSMIMSLYSVVDIICIGKYEGPNGSAAVACFFPLWTLIFAFGLLLGIGGAVLMSQKRGEGNIIEGNKYFTVGLFTSVLISVLIMVLYIVLNEKLLIFCGAKDEILILCKKYSIPIIYTVPTFLIGQFLVSFIRNDEAPLFTTVSIIIGGVLNIFGDIYFVFVLNMGISGAGLATALGQVVAFLILLSYFLTKKCSLKIVIKEIDFINKLKKIVFMGGSNFFIDLAMGMLGALFNVQIMKYYGETSLAVYGVLSSLWCVVQTFGYAIGESSQVILSVNYGAKKYVRIKETVKYASLTSFILGLLCTVVCVAFPNLFIKIYMTATPEVLKIAPLISRCYYTAFIFLIFNVFSTYYFQSIGKPKISLLISLLRGILISGLLVEITPLINKNLFWFSSTIAEFSVMIFVIILIKKSYCFEKEI